MSSLPSRFLARTLASLGRSPRRVVAGSAAVAILLATVVATILVTTVGTGTASTAEVRAKAAEGLALEQTVSGDFLVRMRKPALRPRRGHGCATCVPIVPLPSRFVAGVDGSYVSLTLPLAAPRRSDVAYDARTGIQTSYSIGLGLYIRGRNLDPAAPTLSPYARLGTWVHRALVERSPRIHDTTLDGRPAWKLTVDLALGESLYDDYGVRVEVVVDRETGLVLQLTQYADDPDRWTSIATVRNLRIGVPTTAKTFTVPRPPDARVVTHDYGFRRVPVPGVARIVGYRPLLPTKTGGLALSDVAVAKTTAPPLAPRDARWTYHDVVSARYGRGLEMVFVTTRRGSITDLPGLFEGVSAQTVRIARGALAGSDAMVSTSPLDPGVLAAFHDGLLVRISAATPAQAIVIANALRPTD